LLNTEKTLKMIKRSNTIAWRLEVWQDSMLMIKDRPLFGHGVNTYMPLFQGYRRQIHNYPTYAHNCFIQLACEIGLLGVAAFGWIFLRLFLDGWRRIRTMALGQDGLPLLSLGLLASIGAYLVHSFFDTNLYSLQLGVLLWFLVALQYKVNFLLTERT
jgi:O-antigen ligase